MHMIVLKSKFVMSKIQDTCSTSGGRRGREGREGYQ